MWQVGIIGSGNIGSAVARQLTNLGHQVVMANSRGPDSLEAQQRELGIIPGTVAAAASAADFVLIAIPEGAVTELPAGLFAATPPSAIILDAGNYYPGLRDAEIAEIDAGLPDSVWLARHIGRPVLKMFNTIHANRIVEGARPTGAPNRICLPIAGDSVNAKTKAIALADAIGFDGYDAGTLADSWKQQPGTPVYCKHLPLAEARIAIAQARQEDVATAREQALDRGRELSAETNEKIGSWPAT